MAAKDRINHSYTSLADWRRCRLRFYLSHVEGYEAPQSPGQARGFAGHRALAVYYTSQIKNRKKRIQAAMDAAAEVYQFEEGFEMLESALSRYWDWCPDQDKGWQPITTEYRFEVKLGDVWLVGFIDMVIRWQGNIWLVENKFNQRVETAHLDMDQQVSTYMIGASLSGYSPIGVIYNIVRMGDGPTAIREPVVRKPLYRNPEGLSVKVNEIVAQAAEVEKFMRRGGTIYRNETKDCAWDCAFFKYCLALTDNGSGEGVLDQFGRKDKPTPWMETENE